MCRSIGGGDHPLRTNDYQPTFGLKGSPGEQCEALARFRPSPWQEKAGNPIINVSTNGGNF